MAKKAFKPIKVETRKGEEYNSIRFKSCDEANEWIKTAERIGLIDNAVIILDLENA